MEEDQSQWWETMGKLNRAVRGILNAKDTVDHTLAFFRRIENINVALLRHSMKFIDIASKQIDEEAQTMLSDLRDVRVS